MVFLTQMTLCQLLLVCVVLRFILELGLNMSAEQILENH